MGFILLYQLVSKKIEGCEVLKIKWKNGRNKKESKENILEEGRRK